MRKIDVRAELRSAGVRALAFFGLVGGSTAAFAQAIDTSSVTAAITLAATAIGVIGAAVVAGPVVAKATWKWIKSAV